MYNRPKHPRLYRWLLLYPLYILAEIAIISTDLAELLGSAIALCLLFPRLPLWAGVLLTASDVLLLLALGDPLGARPVRPFEFLIAALVCASLKQLNYHGSHRALRILGLHSVSMYGHNHIESRCALGPSV